ncbi:MAG: primosomal protein N', partial [Stellaceae bacterium]
PELRSVVDWVSNYTLSSRGMVLRMCLRMGEHLGAERERTGVRLAGSPPARMTTARRRVLELLADGLVRWKSDAAREAGVSAGVIDGLIDEGTLETVVLPPEPVVEKPDPDFTQTDFSPAQGAAAAELKTRLAKGGYSVTLLDGVTGSGKTEVYFEAVADAIRSGRQSLILMPEIALTAQFVDRFAARFGHKPAEWHSLLTPRRRARTWRAVADGEVSVVVGARSALFLPYADLGLIVVDEEHDPAYKQEDGVRYHARDMAVVRGHIARIPVVLSSATPSVETDVNALRGRYARLALPERFGGARLPSIEAIDLRVAPPPPRHFISPVLADAVKTSLERSEQALLFLNRRGYAPLTLCRECGHRLQCPNCTAWLVEHRRAGGLQCHHCGYATAMPLACPNCGVTGSFAACGPGVERLAEEVAQRFPQARVALMASDTLSGPRAMAELLEQVERRAVDVLIGTQVMAKGHHFPMLTLVGVVDADLGVSGGDLRATERTFQLLHQVAGRAGRAERPGVVLLQTYMPEHPVMRALASDDRDGFLAAEVESRRDGNWPPFGRLAAIVVSAPDADSADRAAREFARHAPHTDGIEVLGPAPAPLAMLRGRHRRRFLVKARRDAQLQGMLRRWLEAVQFPASVRVQVDVDPYSFI